MLRGFKTTPRIIANICFNNKRKIMTVQFTQTMWYHLKNDKGKSSKFLFLQFILQLQEIFFDFFDYSYKKTYFYIRSSRPEVFYEKRCSQKFHEMHRKNLCQSLFFNKVAGLGPVALLNKRLRHRRFPVDFVKFLRTPFLQNTSGRLLVIFPFSSGSFLCSLQVTLIK